MSHEAFDATDSLFRQNPYPSYTRLRAAGAVPVGAPYGGWWVLRHDLVQRVNASANVFLKPGRDRMNAPRPMGASGALEDGLFFMDAPRHTEVRAAMNVAFAKATAQVRQAAEAVAGKLLKDAKAKGQIDGVLELAKPLALRVFNQIMGMAVNMSPPVPGQPEPFERELAVVDSWINSAMAANDRAAPPPDRLRGATARMALATYLRARNVEVLRDIDAKKVKEPANVLQGLHLCPVRGGGAALSDDERTNTAVHFALGGYLSTQFLIASGLYNLLRHREQWREVCANPDLIPGAVQEMLRFDAPFQMADRWVAGDNNELGVAIKGPSMVTLVYGAANRDPAVYSNPDVFDIHRDFRAKPNLAYGEGAHYCIGAGMANTVAAVVFETLARGAAGVRLGEIGPWSGDPYFRSLTKVQLLFA